MGKNRAKAKRIKKVAEEALESEKRRNAERLPEILPDKVLFREDDGTVKKKKKIVLYPRPVYKKEAKIIEEEIEDIWKDVSTIPINQKKKKSNTQPKKNYPTSNMAYNSSAVVRPPPPPPEEKPEEEGEEIHIEEEVFIEDDLGDSTAGDIASITQVTVLPPEKPEKKKNDLLQNAFIPKTLPDDQKRIKYQELRENRKLLNERIEAERAPEFEKTPEYLKEIIERNEEIAQRPKKEKEDVYAKLFIAEDPEFPIYEKANTLTDLPSDNQPLVRWQLDMERRRKVALHEAKADK